MLCSACGQKNRIPAKHGIPRCGRCKKVLVVGHSHSGSTRRNSVIWWLLATFVVGLAIYSTTQENGGSSRPKTATAPAPSRRDAPPAFTQTPVPISTGVVRQVYGDSIAPLSITADKGSDYYVKIIDVQSKTTIMEIYIEEGRTFRSKLPLGSYELRYASGTTWYGPTHLFGPSTSTYKADRIFSFQRSANSVSGYAIELIRQQGGNLRTSPIPTSQF